MDDIFTQVVQMLVDAEFAAIAVAHNIRKMITKGYCVCSEVAVGVSLDGVAARGLVNGRS